MPIDEPHVISLPGPQDGYGRGEKLNLRPFSLGFNWAVSPRCLNPGRGRVQPSQQLPLFITFQIFASSQLWEIDAPACSMLGVTWPGSQAAGDPSAAAIAIDRAIGV